MPKPALTVELKAIQERTSEAAQFLKSKITGKMKATGTQIRIEGAKTKEIKLLLHKFLHHQGLAHYRVHSQSGVLEVAPPEKHQAHGQTQSGTPPTAPQTQPYLFPQAPTLAPAKKRKPKSKSKAKGKKK